MLVYVLGIVTFSRAFRFGDSSRILCRVRIPNYQSGEHGVASEQSPLPIRVVPEVCDATPGAWPRRRALRAAVQIHVELDRAMAFAQGSQEGSQGVLPFLVLDDRHVRARSQPERTQYTSEVLRANAL